MVWGGFSKMVISLSIIKGSRRAIHQMKGLFFFSFMQCTHGWDPIYSSENINLNPIFSLLFFESRFLIYHHIPNVVVLESGREHLFRGNRVSEFLFRS